MVRHHSAIQPSRLALFMVLLLSALALLSVMVLPLPSVVRGLLLIGLSVAVAIERWLAWFHPPLEAIACDGETVRVQRRGQVTWQGGVITPLFASSWFIACRVFLPESAQTVRLGLFRDQVDEAVFRRLAAFSRSGGVPS